MIRILQISDIHWLAIPDAMDDYNLMRREFLDDIESFHKNGNGNFDHLLICTSRKFAIESNLKSLRCTLFQATMTNKGMQENLH